MSNQHKMVCKNNTSVEGTIKTFRIMEIIFVHFLSSQLLNYVEEAAAKHVLRHQRTCWSMVELDVTVSETCDPIRIYGCEMARWPIAISSCGEFP
jgi:hypothetical protein